MVVMLVPLVFALGALLAAITLTVSWRRYRPVVLANLEALRSVRVERAYDVRIARHPALVGSAPLPWPSRPAAPRRSAAAAGLRAAA